MLTNDNKKQLPTLKYLCLFFLQLFNTTIELSEKSSDLPTRLEICLRETTLAVYTNVAR
jgi:hypothetical protein